MGMEKAPGKSEHLIVQTTVWRLCALIQLLRFIVSNKGLWFRDQMQSVLRFLVTYPLVPQLVPSWI